MSDPQWILVSKPLCPPFRDGSLVHVSQLAAHLPDRFQVDYFGNPGQTIRQPDRGEVLPADAMGYSPGTLAKVRVLSALFHPKRIRKSLHFFFTPNPATSSVLAVVRRLQPNRSMVQTLMSSNKVQRYARLLRPLDAVVALSEHTRRQLTDSGIDERRVWRIYPGVAESGPQEHRLARQRVLYAGDLDADVVDRLVRIAGELKPPIGDGWTLTIACRSKSDADLQHHQRLKSALAAQLAAGDVEILGEVDDMGMLLRDTALQLFVANHVRRKIDLPLVLLEGFARGVPLLTLDFAPVNEIFRAAERHGLEPGRAVEWKDGNDALAVAFRDTISNGEWLRQASDDARELSRQEFSVTGMANRYAQLYDQLRENRAKL